MEISERRRSIDLRNMRKFSLGSSFNLGYNGQHDCSDNEHHHSNEHDNDSDLTDHERHERHQHHDECQQWHGHKRHCPAHRRHLQSPTQPPTKPLRCPLVPHRSPPPQLPQHRHSLQRPPRRCRRPPPQVYAWCGPRSRR